MFALTEWTRRLRLTLSENTLLIVALGIGAPLYFINAFEYSVPMGYAGLFTQMAKQIADANFHLPIESPFYGPGGIPFAYPPFGLYFLAILIKLTGKYFIFLRLLPPLLGLVSFIPLYFITLKISNSRIAAMASVVIAASSPDMHAANAWAAGIVRAPAFLFSLASIYFFLSQLMGQRSWSNILWAGVFFGLACMSHLIYALFCFLWIWWWSLFYFDKHILQRIKDALVISGIGLLVASIWLVPVLFRYGSSIFVSAFGSHGGNFLLSFWFELRLLPYLFLQNISPISSSWPLVLLVLIGVVFLLLKKNLAFPSLFVLVILAFPEAARFVFLMGSIVAGIGLSIVAESISKISIQRLRPILVAVVMIPVLGYLWQEGYDAISRKLPQISSATLDLANQVQEVTPPDQKYLALVKQDEAEWLPFLFQREPVVGKWGGEWLGQFVEQTYFMGLFRNCQTNQDWACVENTMADLNVTPQFLVCYIRDRRLNDSIQLDGAWERVYENDRYTLWKLVN